MSKYLISIVGPTAIGKTALSISLAKHFNTEIISADSRQFYKEMSIGTAAPTKDELSKATHHFIHHKSVTEIYTAGDFERDAIALLDVLFKKHKVVIMVGGSGLFVDAVTKGLDKFPEINPAIRSSLNERLNTEGLESLQAELKLKDLETYLTIDLDNQRRVVRALEVCIGSGKPYSSFLTKNEKSRNFSAISMGLDADRQTIYDRINKRVDIMMSQGLLDEVRSLEKYQNLNALKTVGYKELFSFINGECTLEFAVSEIKKNTRRFAKRQLTWFKKDDTISWYDYLAPATSIIKDIDTKIKEPT